jgi:hypothetical protein
MTHTTGRFGRRFARSDPRGHWGTGVPASAGFMPEEPVILERSGHTFAQTSSNDVDVSRVDVSAGRVFGYCALPCLMHDWGGGQGSVCSCPPKKTVSAGGSSASDAAPGGTLSRAGAERTRGARRSRSRKRRG